MRELRWRSLFSSRKISLEALCCIVICHFRTHKDLVRRCRTVLKMTTTFTDTLDINFVNFRPFLGIPTFLEIKTFWQIDHQTKVVNWLMKFRSQFEMGRELHWVQTVGFGIFRISSGLQVMQFIHPEFYEIVVSSLLRASLYFLKFCYDSAACFRQVQFWDLPVVLMFFHRLSFHCLKLLRSIWAVMFASASWLRFTMSQSYHFGQMQFENILVA